jgi:hypothetical protein
MKANRSLLDKNEPNQIAKCSLRKKLDEIGARLEHSS